MACVIRLSNCSVTGVTSLIIEEVQMSQQLAEKPRRRLPLTNKLISPDAENWFFSACSVGHRNGGCYDQPKKYPKKIWLIKCTSPAFSRQRLWAFNALDSITTSTMHSLNGSIWINRRWSGRKVTGLTRIERPRERDLRPRILFSYYSGVVVCILAI